MTVVGDTGLGYGEGAVLVGSFCTCVRSWITINQTTSMTSSARFVSMVAAVASLWVPIFHQIILALLVDMYLIPLLV